MTDSGQFDGRYMPEFDLDLLLPSFNPRIPPESDLLLDDARLDRGANGGESD